MARAQLYVSSWNIHGHDQSESAMASALSEVKIEGLRTVELAPLNLEYY